VKHHYREIGFDGVYLLNGITVTPIGDSVETVIQNICGLHVAILRALCTCNVNLNGDMIRCMRIELDLSQTELGRILGWTDRQSLSLCELEKQKMPVAQQIILKLMVLSRVDGETSVGKFVGLIGEEAPEFFDFRFTGSEWVMEPEGEVR
jgi:DNA-binding XRE family transcriptional regulator